MKKIFYMISFILVLALAGCSGTTSSITTGGKVTTNAQKTDSEMDSTDKTVTLTYNSKSNNIDLSKSGDGSAVLSPEVKYASGDVITVSLPKNEKYLAISLCKKVGEAIVYVPDGKYTYTVPADMSNYYPTDMYKGINTISARIPEASELTSERNLAFNPYDVKTQKTTVYPHAYSNNNYNNSEFGAHNAIDGVCKNTQHGMYPYQSWGPNSTVKASDFLMIDFGREVSVNEIVLYLRADFSGNHDAYFSSVKVEFSDGSSITINPEAKASAQNFKIDTVKTTFIKLTGFVTDTSKGTWAGYTEVQVTGSDAG